MRAPERSAVLVPVAGGTPASLGSARSVALVEGGGAGPGVRGEARAAGRGAQPLGGAGEAGPSVHTNSKDSVSDTRDEKRRHLGKPAAFPLEWRDFEAYMDGLSDSLLAEGCAYDAECRKRADQYQMPMDGPCLRRAAMAIADAARDAAALERGRRARPLLAIEKAARKVAKYGNGVQSAVVVATLAARVQKIAKRSKTAIERMKTDATAFGAIVAKAWEYAESQRIVAEARAKADEAIDLRAQAETRAAAMKLCARSMTIAQCGACGEFAEGTGALLTMHCHARGCPCCARHKSMQDFHELRDAMKAVPKREGYSWKMIEQTLQRNPRDSRLHTVDALIARIEALFRIGKHVWDTYLDRIEGTAMYIKLECAGTGNVHAHLVVYAPFIPKALLEGIVRQVKGLPNGVKHGFTWIDLAKTDEDAIAAEATKYVTKSCSPMSEDWLAGTPREVLHSTLAARWELATMGRALSRMYGALREAEPEEEEKDETEPDDDEGEENKCPEHCEHCGVIGEMQIVVAPTKETVRAMHAKGMRALRGSRWTPRPAEKPPPMLVEKQREHDSDVVLLVLRDLRSTLVDDILGYLTVVPRAAINDYLADVDVLRADDLAPLSRPAAEGATWMLTIENERRVRVKLEQVVFEAAA